MWGSMASVELWQALVLSVGCNPAHPPPADSRSKVNKEYRKRLQVAESHLGSGGTLPLLGEAGSGQPRVRLPDFARWAVSLKWKVPKEFSVWLETGGAPPVAPAAEESAPDRGRRGLPATRTEHENAAPSDDTPVQVESRTDGTAATRNEHEVAASGDGRAALSALGRLGAEARHAPTRDAKALVLDWWSQRRGTMSKEAAADAIVGERLISEARSTIRRWLIGA